MSQSDIVYFSFWTDQIPSDWPIVDCRCIKNPFSKHASDAARWNAVRQDRNFMPLVREGVAKYKEHGKVAIGCEFGRHRSRVVAEEIGRILSKSVEKWY